jgi:hypothetical protein
VIRYRYNKQLQPPAPFVHLRIRNPATGKELANVPAQVDSAADRTVLPDRLVHDLELSQIGTTLIGGLGGITYTLATYVVFIGVHDLPYRSIKIVANADEEWALLGRDVLDSLRIVLDGPQGILEIG